MDGLSALFLVPIFLVSMLGSVYWLGYWKQAEHLTNGRKLRLFYGLLPAGMALLVIARNSILFMLGWEVMALSAFYLVTCRSSIPRPIGIRKQRVNPTWVERANSPSRAGSCGACGRSRSAPLWHR